MLRAWRSERYKAGTLGLSLGWGMSIGFAPLVGLQMVLCVAITLIWNRLLKSRLSVAAMIVGSFVVNPLTMAPTYFLYYQLGCGMITCGKALDREAFSSPLLLLQQGGDISLAILLGSAPFVIVGFPVGLWLGNRVEALLEARRLRRRKGPQMAGAHKAKST